MKKAATASHLFSKAPFPDWAQSLQKLPSFKDAILEVFMGYAGVKIEVRRREALCRARSCAALPETLNFIWLAESSVSA